MKKWQKMRFLIIKGSVQQFFYHTHTKQPNKKKRPGEIAILLGSWATSLAWAEPQYGPGYHIYTSSESYSGWTKVF